MKCLVHLLVSLFLLSGCSTTRDTTRTSILDQLLVPSDVVGRVQAAERDLPDDEWATLPKIGHTNRSRSDREIALAHELLPTIKPRLTQMSPRELIDSIKTFPYAEYGSFPGVAYYIYRDGNQMVIKELAQRSQDELKSLRPFREDRREVFTGDSGPPLSIGDLVRYDLLHEPY